MSYNFEVESGNTVKFPVGGKYCDRDIVVTAFGGSDTDVEDGLVTRTLTEYSNDRITSVGAYAFTWLQSLKSIDIPNLTSVGNNAFQACTGLSKLDFPNCIRVGNSAFASCNGAKSMNFPVLEAVPQAAFNSCTAITEAYAPMVRTIGTQGFYFCSRLTKMDFQCLESLGQHGFSQTKLETLIIRKIDGVCTLVNTNAFLNSPIVKGTGYIYVPAALVDSYKAATNWSTYADQIRAIEDYPDICGV